MNATPTIRRLSHVCLPESGITSGDVGGTFLSHARLNDQQRIAVLFQGAALLAHLEHAGFYLGTGSAETAWEDARVDSTGRLIVGEVRYGRAANLPQTILQHLLRAVFQTEGTVVGRGAARKIARRQAERWHHRLMPVRPDLVVADLLDSAPFLWTPSFAYARRALVAEHWHDDEMHLWVVGPGRSRRSVLTEVEATAPSKLGLSRLHGERLLEGDDAEQLWRRFDVPPGADPWDLYRNHRKRQAAAIWRGKARRTAEETLAYADCLRATGRAGQAAQLLQRRRDVEALLLRAGCQMDLDERSAAERALRHLDWDDLDDLQKVSLAEIQVRLAAGRYRQDALRTWLGKVLSLTEEPGRSAGRVVAAGAAFDSGESVAMGRYLEEADLDVLADLPEWAAKWHQQEGLRRWQAEDGPGSVEHLGKALGIWRRQAGHLEAGRLWNDLAVAREGAGDLEGAEHACRHSLRLFALCEGRAMRTLGLVNLAELRARRGLVRGVAQTLEQSTALNRLAANKRGLAHDLEIWARYELALGRPTAALARCAEARVHTEVCNRDRLDALAARAHGWLGQTQEARNCLDQGGAEAVTMLEQEERPAVWALAGRYDEACREAEGTVWQELWTCLAVERHPPSTIWHELDQIDPFRAARLIFDLELLLPGVAPPRRLRKALQLFRRRKLTGFAEFLEHRSSSSWKALDLYFQRPPSLESMAELLSDTGYSQTRLILRHGEEESVLIGGPESMGGVTRRSRELQNGNLVLETPGGAKDPICDALLSVFAADLQERRHAEDVLADETEAPTATDEAPRSSWVGRDGILGDCPKLLTTLDKIDKLAKGRLPVLILGESGTGKERIARRVHQQSSRRDGPWVPLNCAAISPTLIQSTLFGHVRGAFTGADQNRAGIFETARGGTVFLDEIGDLPKEVQGNLLRVLQEGEIRRIGESLARKVDVRIVAATHCDLAQMVEDKTFRQDLYFRLKVAKVELPPLRDRGRDVLLLAEHFATSHRSEGLEKAAKSMLAAYHWPGNIRELMNIIEVAAVYADFGRIGAGHLKEAGLPTARDEPTQKAESSMGDGAGGVRKSFSELVEDYRKELISEALKHNNGNQSAAARDLKTTRQNFSYLARKFGLI